MHGQAAVELVVEVIELAMGGEHGNKTRDGVLSKREVVEKAAEMYLRDERKIKSSEGMGLCQYLRCVNKCNIKF